MPRITIRNLDEKTKKRLRVRAASNDRSTEEEARVILREALTRKLERTRNLAEAIRARFESLGGVELDIPPRELPREAPVPTT